MRARTEWKSLPAALLLTTVLLFAGSSHAIEVSVHDLSVSSGSILYGDLVILPVGETVTIGIRVEDPTATAWAGIGLSYYGYDGGLLDFVDGEAVPYLFSNLCFPSGAPTFCADQLPNLVGGGAPTAGNRVLVENAVFPGVPLSGEPRVRAFFVWQHLGAVAGYVTGPDDLGLDGVYGGGDAHARVTFEGLSDGITEITIGTGDDLGGILLQSGGIPVAGGATNARIRLAVPEPGMTSLLLAGVLATLAASGRRQLSQ